MGKPGPIKIGKASDLKARLAGLQTGSPVQLELIGGVPAPAEAEREIHKVLGSYRYVREWFHPAPEVLDFVQMALSSTPFHLDNYLARILGREPKFTRLSKQESKGLKPPQNLEVDAGYEEEEDVPIYLVRWEDKSMALIRAVDVKDLVRQLDEVGNPFGASWTRYDGPVWVDFASPTDFSPEEHGHAYSLGSTTVPLRVSVPTDTEGGTLMYEQIIEAAFPHLHESIQNALDVMEDDACLDPDLVAMKSDLDMEDMPDGFDALPPDTDILPLLFNIPKQPKENDADMRHMLRLHPK